LNNFGFVLQKYPFMTVLKLVASCDVKAWNMCVVYGLVYLANALDGLSSGGASLALLKMLGIPSVASFPKGQESDRKIRPLKSRI